MPIPQVLSTDERLVPRSGSFHLPGCTLVLSLVELPEDFAEVDTVYSADLFWTTYLPFFFTSEATMNL